MPVVEKINIISVVLQIAVLAVLLPMSVKLIRLREESLTAVFLSFCLALWLFTDMYWLIYDLMRPESRMPFAANEVGEAAFFLMMAALPGSAVLRGARPVNKQTVCAVIFGICNVVLWILWSGEWVQDMIIGAVFTWFFYNVTASLKLKDTAGKREWIFIGILCLFVIISQGLTFIDKGRLSAVSELCGYGILIIGVIYWIYKFVRAMKAGTAPETLVALSVASVAWAIMSKYMSAGNWYSLFLLVESLCLPSMYISVRKVVEQS